VTVDLSRLHDKRYRMDNLYYIIDRNGSNILFQMNDVQKDVFENLHNRNLILKARQLGMCLDPNTKVLRSDFTWVKISDIEIGDEIIGVDEHAKSPGCSRQLRKGVVQGTKRCVKQSYKIHFDNGKSLICSDEHRWLTRNSSTIYHWRKISGVGSQKLKVGHRIRRFVPSVCEEWDFKNSWDFGDEWEGKKIPHIKCGNYSTITKIESLDERELVDLQTSIKTFIAEGYVSHNSTFAVLYLLDEVLFNFNLSAGIVSYSLQHAKHVLKRIIGNAIDCLPRELHPIGLITRSAHELSFNNGSHLQVNTTLRGGTCQLVLISEFGKTCARSPLKADEIMAGTLNTLPQEGTVIIESTGEGTEGHFADMVMAAKSRGNEDLSPLEYKLFFYPWYLEKAYVMDYNVKHGVELTDYFDEVEKESKYKLSKKQKNWYAHQRDVLKDKIGQEFPSTVEESFLSNSDAYYFAEGVQKAYKEDRCLYSSLYDPLDPVYVALDIGVNDQTAMVFFQVTHGEIRIIDYYSDMNKGVDFYVKFLTHDKDYNYHTIFLPHDASKRDGIVVENTYEREFRHLLRHSNTRVTVLKRTDVQPGIANARSKLDRCVFNLAKVKGLIDHLAKYRKQWSEQYGKYLDKPLHDEHSDPADAFRYACSAVDLIEKGVSQNSALEKHREVVASRKKRI